MAGTAIIGWSTKNLSLSFISSSNATTGTTLIVSLTSVPAGSLLVLTIAQPDQASDAPNVDSLVSSPVLTWTKEVDAQLDASGNAEIWTAPFSAGGNIDVTITWGTNGLSAALYAVSNVEAVLSGAENIGTAQTLPSVNITTTKPESYIFAVTSDWSAINAGTYRIYKEGATEKFYEHRAGIYTAYHYYVYVPNIRTLNMGVIDPSGQAAGTALYEIRNL